MGARGENQEAVRNFVVRVILRHAMNLIANWEATLMLCYAIGACFLRLWKVGASIHSTGNYSAELISPQRCESSWSLAPCSGCHPPLFLTLPHPQERILAFIYDGAISGGGGGGGLVIGGSELAWSCALEAQDAG